MNTPTTLKLTRVNTLLNGLQRAEITRMVERALEAGLTLADALRAAEMAINWEAAIVACERASERCIRLRSLANAK